MHSQGQGLALSIGPNRVCFLPEDSHLQNIKSNKNYDNEYVKKIAEILLHLFYLGSGTACFQKTIYSFAKEPCLITCRDHLNFYQRL
jgi:hypothetical protein